MRKKIFWRSKRWFYLVASRRWETSRLERVPGNKLLDGVGMYSLSVITVYEVPVDSSNVVNAGTSGGCDLVKISRVIMYLYEVFAVKV